MIRYYIFILLLSVSLSILADDEYSKIEFKSQKLTDSIYMLEGAGGNITASIGTDGVLLIDDDFAEMSNKLVTKLKELGGNSPRFIINTHFHYDHTDGNKAFGASATIIAATEVRNRLMSEQLLWHSKHSAFPKVALPLLTFNDSLTLHFNDEEIRIIHLANGHTDGDTVVFFDKNKVASLGDLYFAGMYPIFHPEHNGNLTDYIKNIDFILGQIPIDEKIVSGHGSLSTKVELQRYCEMLKDSVAVVQSGITKGLSLDQIQKIGLPAKWESFSHGYLTTDKWIALVYSNLVLLKH